jgi:endonuclease/exonuclease/phosphatase family metal-dependent hydrolase
MFGRTIVKWGMMASNIIAAGFMLMTLIGTVLSPEKLVLPAYFALIFPLAIIVNIGFVIFWLLIRKWFFLFSLSILLFSASEIRSTFPVHIGEVKSSIHTPSNSIKFLTYNTRMCGELKKHTHRSHNKVIQYVLDSNADIVCLQEFTVSDNNEYLTLKDVYRIFKKYPYKHIQFKQKIKENGVATFSKYPITNKQVIDYPSSFNNSIYSDINIKGKTIRVINNHLESNRLTEKDKNMPGQLRDNFDAKNLTGITRHFSQKLGIAYKLRAFQADAVAKSIAESPYKVIVCGDFNDVPASYAYETIKGDLKDAFAETGTGLGWTFNDRYYHFRIDYVFYDSSAINLTQYKTDNVNYSDHYPVLCQIELKDIQKL